MLTGLDGWEIVVLAGICGLGYMMAAGTFAVTLAWLVYGEKVVPRTPAVVAPPAAQPLPVASYTPAAA
jgi:hypothetical protein